jgi:3-hydroxyacyl-CoA dehydrogenase
VPAFLQPARADLVEVVKGDATNAKTMETKGVLWHHWQVTAKQATTPFVVNR